MFTKLEIDFPGTGILTGSFIVPLESLCNLMVWIDPELHCVCSSDFSLSTGPIQILPQPEAVICSNEIVEIGWCEGDFETLWEDATLLDCIDCCPANFQFDNQGQVAESFELIQLLSLGECEIEAIFNITVLPEPGILFADTMICMGDTATLLATGPGIYDWTGPGIINPTLQGQLVSPTISSWYILSVEDINGCPNLDSVFVEVLMLPTVDVSSDTVICSGAPLQLETLFDPGWTFEWTPASLLDDPFTWNPNFIGTTDTTLYVLVSNILGCSVLDSVNITFADDPELIAPADQILCLGLTDTLTVSGADNYLWEPAVDCLDPNCASVSISPTLDVTYQVVGMNASGCSDTAFVLVDVLDGSLINDSEVNICEGEVVDILGNPTSVAGIYCDTLELAGGCLEISCVELFVNPEEEVGIAEFICPGDSLSLGGGIYYEPGDYFMSLQTWQGCDSLIDLSLSWYPLPDLAISPEEINLFNGQSAILEIFGGGPGYTYNWSNPDQLSCSDCPNPTTAPLGDDVEFVVEVTDENGCVQILSVRIDIISDCDGLSEQIPNAFTPNDDDINDFFRIPGEGIFTGGVELEIWNRWGELILRDDSGAPFWDGTQNGEAAPQDVYVYRFFVVCSDGEMLEIYGEVQLIR